MSLLNINSGNRIIVILINVLVYMVLYGFSPIYADDQDGETAHGSEANSADERDILAEIGSKTITRGELLKQYNLYFLMSEFSRTYEKGLTVTSYLDHYISEFLMLNIAKDMAISVSQDEVDKEKKRFLKLFRFSEDNLIKWLDSKSLTIEDAEQYLKNSLILERLCFKKFGALKISDEEERDYYKTHNEYYDRPAKIRASHILICHRESRGCNSKLSREQAKELAESVLKSVTPENFATLAERYSYDSTGRSGGSLGVVTEGSAAPAFEKAAFSLGNGEISNVVETDYGYHIIYVTDKAEKVFIPFEEARESIEYTLEKKKIITELSKYSEQLLMGAKIKKYSDGERKAFANKLPAQSSDKKDSLPVKQYSTFRATGKGINKNSKGQPIIMIFTRKGCHVCEWVEDTFDETVMEYVEKGLIEAHHYDFLTGDDLLTPEIETTIPKQYFELFEYENPQSSTPYYNFGGMYYRRGAGYMGQDDLYAEEMEMKQVIDDLLK